MTRRRRTRAGFTLLEITIALAILGLVFGNVFIVLGPGQKVARSNSTASEVETLARRTLDKIALAIVGAAEEHLYLPNQLPGYSTDSLQFRSSLGMQSGEVVLSPTQKIALIHDPDGEVAWYENPGEPAQKRVIWSRCVASVLEGEIPANGLDDNANGVVDESGLAFEKEGRLIRIFLTILQRDADDKIVARTLRTQVTCRN